MIGYEIQDEPEAPRRQSFARASQAGPATEMIVDHVTAYAVGRPDDVVNLPVG